ncbi:MAG: hypothetical protein ACXACA_08795, partial [Candidatus Ranarchaeia archaeon]
PIFTASGATSHDAAAVKEAVTGGAGGIICDTISLEPSVNPRPYLQVYSRKAKKSVISAELANETKWEYWVEKEYKAILEYKLPVVASIGYSIEDMKNLAPKVEKARVSAIALSSRFLDSKKIVPLAKAIREVVKLPLLLKISPEKPGIVDYALKAQDFLDGYIACDSYAGAVH